VTWQGNLKDAIIAVPIEVSESDIIKTVFETFEECRLARQKQIRDVYD
jgi:hypothetical protein